MKNNKIKVSIIVPVYGVEKYIDKCLDSLVNQTLKDIEIIVVNDGSLDNSQKIVDKYVKKYPKMVKSYIKKNGGQGSARNFGIKHSIGEYIGYVDSDDYVELDMYEKLYKKAKSKKYEIVVCGNYNVKEDYSSKIEDVFVSSYQTNLENSMFGKIAVWNKIYKRELIVDNNLLFAENMWYEDLAFTIKAILNAKMIGFIDEPLYNYLIREGSTMNNSKVKRNLEILMAFDDILYYVRENRYKQHIDKIEFLAIDHIYISTIVRIIRAEVDNELKNETIETILKYMNDNFPNYENNKYIKTLSRNRKIVLF